MGLYWRKRKKVGPVTIHAAGRGLSSVSAAFGNLTYNTRRGWTVRLPFGLTWRRRG